MSLCCAVGALIWCLILEESRPKVGFIQMDKVFEAFNMKQELESDFQKRLDASNGKIEQFNMRKLAADFNQDSLGIVNEILEREMALLKQYMTELKPQYDYQIQNQLAQYLNDYVKGTDLDLFFTSLNGSTILYGEPSLDHSERVIEYINNKYEGLD